MRLGFGIAAYVPYSRVVQNDDQEPLPIMLLIPTLSESQLSKRTTPQATRNNEDGLQQSWPPVRSVFADFGRRNG